MTLFEVLFKHEPRPVVVDALSSDDAISKAYERMSHDYSLEVEAVDMLEDELEEDY